jgi:acetate kinase
VRAAACQGLEFLGVRLDEELNRSAGGDSRLSDPAAPAAALVVAAREDLEIAREVRRTLEPGRAEALRGRGG